jgi:DNA-directed RNA polymerase subunit F
MSKKCPICESIKVYKKGKRDGKQRYHCTDCFHNFSCSNLGVKQSNQFVWFKKWVIERQVFKYLVRDSMMSQSTIQRLFKIYLAQAPNYAVKSKKNVHLIIDGTYFSNGLCLILYYDNDIQYVQLFRETNQEKFKEIKEDLLNLKKLGVEIYSVTCDGHKAIMKAIKVVYPNAIIQRCLVHVKRQVRSYLSNNPKMEIAKELLEIAKKITRVDTIEKAHFWLVGFQLWHTNNQDFINEITLNEDTKRWWFKHRNLHLACTHLINAIPNMFAYLNDPSIPYSSNEIEGYFSHLKEKVTLHRGLSFENKKNFIKWYIHFKNQRPC